MAEVTLTVVGPKLAELPLALRGHYEVAEFNEPWTAAPVASLLHHPHTHCLLVIIGRSQILPDSGAPTQARSANSAKKKPWKTRSDELACTATRTGLHGQS